MQKSTPLHPPKKLPKREFLRFEKNLDCSALFFCEGLGEAKKARKPIVKVLIDLFQKVAGCWGGAPTRAPQSAKEPRRFSFVNFSLCAFTVKEKSGARKQKLFWIGAFCKTIPRSCLPTKGLSTG